MMARAIFQPRAELDIDEQYLYLGRQSSDVADRFLRHVELTVEALVDSPDVGLRWSSIHNRLTDLRVSKVRRFPNHLIFYRPCESGIEIVRVLHSARNIEQLFDAGEMT
jgi:toxin ParE1/3/4